MRSKITRAFANESNRGIVMHSGAAFALFLWGLFDCLWYSSLSGTVALVYLLHTIGTCVLHIVCEAVSEGPGNSCITPNFPFGFARLRILLTYGNACVLMFFSLTTVVEGVETLILGQTPTCRARLIILQLAVHGVYEAYLSSKVPVFGTPVRRSLAIRVIRRCIPSLLALVSCFFDEVLASAGHYEGTVDAMCAIASGYYCLHITWPLAKQCCNVLLQKAPGKGTRAQLDKTCREIQGLPGVLDISDGRYWSLKENEVVGSMRVRVRDASSAQKVLGEVRHAFSSLLSTVCIQVDTNSETVMQRMASFSSATGFSPTLAAPPAPLPTLNFANYAESSGAGTPQYSQPQSRLPVTPTMPGGNVARQPSLEEV